MANNNQQKQFLNGIFTKVVWRNTDPAGVILEDFILSVGIKKEDFIKELQAIPADDRGWINLTMGVQKDDKKKVSTWVDTYVRSGVSASPSQPASTPPETQNQSDDLPF